jgi:glycine hydroxymethyltransferase
MSEDRELFDLLDGEQQRQETTLTLIASENHCSGAVRRAAASVITDKYAEGYPGARYYGGCEYADKVEELARLRALVLFPGAEHCNVQPHSGATANLAALEALAGVNGRILGMALNAGGHLTHGHPMNATGRLFTPTQYGTHPETGWLDYDLVRKLALESRPKVIIAGGSSYPRKIDYAAMRKVADEVGAVLMADIAHPAGMIAAGVLPSPIPAAQVVTMTTHKTLRGPRGGLILCSKDLQKAIDKAVFPGAQGGPLMHLIAAKAVAFGEALQPAFKAYQAAVLRNAARLAEQLQAAGMKIVTGGTDTHMVVVDLRGLPKAAGADVTGQWVEERAFQAGIVLNKNMVPGDPRPPRVTSGVRLGTPAMSSRGMGVEEVDAIAKVLTAIVRGEDPAKLKPTVRDLCARFQLPG